ncbi:MAG: hypothetical protein B6I37_08865 [Desulfobacteraceae bacterium 4572_35.2]|nr:MAG: hypothetical protein B6I37_08865 [Desulfobacteraceae bacterium 4572_35.2]
MRRRITLILLAINIAVTVQNPVLGFHPTPTLDIENIQLNVVDKNLNISIKKLHVGVSWQNILRGEFHIAHLDIIQPDIDWLMTPPAGKSPSHGSPLTTFNTLSSTLDQVRIIDGSLRLHTAHIQNLHSSQFASQSPYHADGPIDIQLNIDGQLCSGMNIQTAIVPSDNQPLFIVGSNVNQPLHSLTISTSMRCNSNQLQFDEISANYNGLTVAGALSLEDWQTQPRLHTNLHTGDIALNQAQQWLPESLTKQIPAQLEQATVRCQKLIVDGPLAGLNLNHVLETQITIKQPELAFQEIHGRNVSANILWQDNQLELSTTALTYQHNKISLQGPLQIKMAQQQNNMWLVTADISRWSINLAEALKKTAKQAGRVTFQLQPADRTDHSWAIDHGELQLPGYRLLFSADHSANDLLLVDLELPQYQLETISQEIPLLTQMELKGEISASYHIEKKSGQPATGSGQVQLNDCAISPTFTIAPIHHINGIIAIENFSAQAPKLTLVLGDSAMTASASIKDLRHPVAEIHAMGDGVSARDLVFNSAKMRLNNLDGRIAIHAKGIDFIDASVDLEQGTHATVNGSLLFKGPLLELDIDAPYANINEIIALWSDQEAKPHKTRSHQSSLKKDFINIKAYVEQGVISGFEFQQARGTIHYKTGQLRVEPLHFQADKGTGSGTVTVTRNSNTTNGSQLKISGTLFDINSDKGYQQLLGQVGLVTGTLNGNFTIQGPIGSKFLDGSQGNVALDIKNGVLRQFKTLSKAFSILNVAQLFSLKLPDMDKEGMPFRNLTGTITFDRGVLHSENLVINSPAMGVSVIGDHNLINHNVDLIMAIKPLGTVDTIVKHIPIAGWILAGEEQAVITTHFKVSRQKFSIFLNVPLSYPAP